MSTDIPITAPLQTRHVVCKSARVSGKPLHGHYTYQPRVFAEGMALSRRELEDALLADFDGTGSGDKRSHYRGYSKADLVAVYADNRPVQDEQGRTIGSETWRKAEDQRHRELVRSHARNHLQVALTHALLARTDETPEWQRKTNARRAGEIFRKAKAMIKRWALPLPYFVSKAADEGPAVGDPATVAYWTDREPATVTYVSANMIRVRPDDWTRIDRNGLSEDQRYACFSDPSREEITFTRRVRGWVRQGDPAKGGTRCFIGLRRRYSDPSF